MRFAMTLSAALLSSTAAFADDLLIRADIAEATVYLSAAQVIRRASVAIPAGEHRVLIAMPDAAQADLFEIEGPEGVTLGPPQRISGYAIEEGSLDTPPQAAARATVETAQDALQQAQDALSGADAAIRALLAQLDYLAALTRGGADGVAMPEDPALVPQFLATLGAENARVQGELQTAQIARRDLAEALIDRQTDLANANAAFARLRPLGTTIDVIEVPVRAVAGAEGELTLGYLTYSAGWEPSYDMDLDSETGQLDIDRFITVYASGAADWRDVAMTFSTAEPARQRAPSVLSPSSARIAEPVEAENLSVRSMQLGQNNAVGLMAAPVPAMEPAVIVEDRATFQVDGLSVTYAYGSPVTIGPAGETILPLDTLTLDAETEARAVPRFDDTAFLVAMIENDTGEPILPGAARYYRDGALLGEDQIPLIADGADTDLAFGALDHLRLVWIDRSLAEGDRGVFTSSSTQERAIAFGVENTSGAAETVRVLYATPFTEQEDLGMDLTLSPQPDDRDIDDQRGIHAWDLEVAAGGTELVEMEISFDWPEGQVLNWRP